MPVLKQSTFSRRPSKSLKSVWLQTSHLVVSGFFPPSAAVVIYPTYPAGFQLTHVVKSFPISHGISCSITSDVHFFFPIALHIPNGFLWQRWHYGPSENAHLPMWLRCLVTSMTLFIIFFIFYVKPLFNPQKSRRVPSFAKMSRYRDIYFQKYMQI